METSDSEHENNLNMMIQNTSRTREGTRINDN